MASYLVIRQADPTDYDLVIGQLDAWWGDRQMMAGLPRLFFIYFRPWTYVAERNDMVVGFLAAFRSQTDPSQVYCHYIGVDPSAHDEGIGQALYHRLFVDASLAGCREVLAITSPVNKGSIAFHARMGFTPLPGDADTDGIPYSADYDGPGEDRVRFHRNL